MGMFDKWFGGRKDYPPLPADNEAMAKLDEVKAQLEELAKRVHEHLEVVPAEHEAYVYLGHPPKRFGVAWIHDGKVTSLNELVEEHHLSREQAVKLVDDLGHAYEHASEETRYSTDLAGKRVVVIPSLGLGQEVHDIVDSAIH